MIVNLTGTLLKKDHSCCVIDVGGVGYGVRTSLNALETMPEVGERVNLPVHTYVREDQMVLFGFSSEEERALFLKLIQISGIGPKIAMAVLSGLPPANLVKTIDAGDSARLATIPGIGKKTAERMVVELKGSLARDPQLAPAVGEASVLEDATSALANLGYPRQTAEVALRKAGVKDGMQIEEAIRAALKELCRG